MTGPFDFAVVGAGLVGSAIAMGLLRHGARVCIFDPQEDDLHASAGNFGLVWVQGKGLGSPQYASLTRRSAAAWQHFCDELAETTGVDPAYRRSGGLKIALTDAELETHRQSLLRAHNTEAVADTQVIGADDVREMVPAASEQIAGGVWCPLDGHADPLSTHQALRKRILAAPETTLLRRKVDTIRPDANGFRLITSEGPVHAENVVLAAGLGTGHLAQALGMHAPLRPERGQILVTERTAPFLDVACHTVRQTTRNTVIIGDSKEDVGFDRSTTSAVAAAIAARAVRLFPTLKNLRIVRQWGALRVLSPDGLPIYAQSPLHPGAFMVTCHSGVTLAAAHAGEVADAIASGNLASRYETFSQDRFGVAA